MEAQNAWARIALERDRLGRVVAETVNGRRIASAYDCCGNRTARTGLGAAVASAYDPLGALAGLRIGEHAPLSLGRDAVGRLVRQVGGRVGGPDAPAGRALERVSNALSRLRPAVSVRTGAERKRPGSGWMARES